MPWNIDYFPNCTHHVFLSHCAEDRRWLAMPIYDALQARRLIPWIDLHDYPYGRTSFEALRDGVLRSRHIVFLVTNEMLMQTRAWAAVELAWAELLQDNLVEPGATLQNISLPLFFLDRQDARIARSVWQRVRDRAQFHHPNDGDAVEWAVQQIARFLDREETNALDTNLRLTQDKRSWARLNARRGLVARITARYPITLP